MGGLNTKGVKAEIKTIGFEGGVKKGSFLVEMYYWAIWILVLILGIWLI